MMKKILHIMLLSLVLPSCTNATQQQNGNDKNEIKVQQKSTSKTGVQEFRVMCYNVENLFDVYDDPKKNDDDFLPNGTRHWTEKRYYTHLRKTAQVINAVGEWGTPAICGLCEVENDTVLTHLLNRTPLKEQNYRYCITTGSDGRGINNALIYQRDKFQYKGHSSVQIRFSNKKKRSRDILHVWGRLLNGEMLDILVCHFPSRYQGEKETEQDRMDAANAVLQICDEVYAKNKNANIIIMGDFNDSPSDKSIQAIVNNPRHKMYNLFGDSEKLNFEGTHSFQGEWTQLDQMIVNQHWFQYLKDGSPQIYVADFLLTKKSNKRIQRPIRTYSGVRYEGGYSDHLPIFADFLIPFSKK